MKISNSSQELLHERAQFYLENKSHRKIYTYNHFKAKKLPKSTICSIIYRVEKEIGLKHIQVVGLIKKRQRSRIRNKNNLDYQDGISQRQA